MYTFKIRAWVSTNTHTHTHTHTHIYIYIYIYISFSRHYLPPKTKAFPHVLPEENFGGHWQCDEDEFWLHVYESSCSDSAAYTQEYFDRICRLAVLKTIAACCSKKEAATHNLTLRHHPKSRITNTVHNFPALVTAARATKCRNVRVTAILFAGHRTLLFIEELRDNRNGIISIALSSKVLKRNFK